MRNVIEYELVGDRDANNFNNTINKMLKKGWQPWGDGFSDVDGYYQPMVKYSVSHINKKKYSR